MSEKHVLRAEGLCKTYGKRPVLSSVSVGLTGGEIVGLLGPNGAGKTTTFSIIVGIIRPDSGVIKYDGEDITVWPMHKRARRGVTYLPQEPSVFRKLTVEENIKILWEINKNIPKDHYETRLTELLTEMGLLGLECHYPYQERRGTVQYFIELANKFGLIITGSRDFHGFYNHQKANVFGTTEIEPVFLEQFQAVWEKWWCIRIPRSKASF